MPFFREKPVVIEAVQFTGSVGSANEVLAWIGVNGGGAYRVSYTKPDSGLMIRTLDVDMHARPGDWIIKGVQGEFYPCKPDIFAATYEPAPEAA
ncbi:MAG: hypothetical protein ACK4LQ_02155 [Pararhodobacter sp.]